MIMDRITLRKIQKSELNILKTFIRCCHKLNVKYFLVGGTLLGAVRHKGFIPWDDDIDVGMLRKDYEIFLKHAQAILPSYYFIQCIDSEPELLFNFAKIRDSRTTFIETSLGKLKINHGVYIDVFPLDYYPEDLAAQKKVDRAKKKLNLRIRKEFVIPIENRQSTIKEFIFKLIGAALSVKYPNVRTAILEREALYKSCHASNLVTNHGGAWGKKEIVPVSWFGEGTVALFEGVKVNIPKCYDELLTQLYGNYMQLPPKDKRVPHHYTDVIDLDRPYTEYIK